MSHRLSAWVLSGHALAMSARIPCTEGSLHQTHDAVRSLAADLQSPLYLGVEQRHREAVIKRLGVQRLYRAPSLWL